MVSGLLLTVGAGLIAYAFYRWAILGTDYFSTRNLPFQKPTFLFGSTAKFYYGRCTVNEFSHMLYNWFPKEKFYGVFDFRQPVVVIRDPEIVRQIAIKDFDHFEDHRTFLDFSSEELVSNSLVMLKGQRWRDMRGTLSPVFTGSKMRHMFDFVSECADEMTKYFVKQAAKGEKIDLEMKDTASRYASDVIASCAFGIQVNSFENPDNEFFVTGKQFLAINSPYIPFIMVLNSVLFFIVRKLKLNVQLMPASIRNFFTKIVIDTMDDRKKRGVFRQDMINVLMQMRQGESTEQDANEVATNSQRDNAGFAAVEESEIGRRVPQRQWTDKEIISQGFLFFTAGFEVTSTVFAFLTYELSINPDIQQKLYEEIAEVHENLDGKRISYEVLQKMKYLDQVVTEGLRKWTTTFVWDRLCVKDYELEYDDGKKFRIEKGMPIWVPVYAMHQDPQYYPDPEKFDPDRFSDENKHNIVPGTYMPFGIGPRNCIGEYLLIYLLP